MRSVFIISLSTIPTQLQSYILLLGPGILLRHIRLALTTMEATVSVKTPITLHRPFSRSPVRYRVLLDACKLIKYLVFISGVAIYYMSPLWPYAVDSAISVDTGPQEIVDLMDHSRPVQNGGEETVQSQVVWGRSGLTNGTHTVVVSLHSNYIVVDAFMYVCLFSVSLPFNRLTWLVNMYSYTIDDADDLSSSSSASSSASSLSSISSSIDRSVASATTSPSSSTTNTHASSHSSNHIVAITVSCIAGALAVTVIVILLLWCCRRRKKNHISSSSPILDDSPLQSNIWPGNNTAYDRPWADQMSVPPVPLASSGVSYTHLHMAEAIGDFDPIATRRPRPPPSGVRTLSTISESSRSSHPTTSLLPPQASFNDPAEMGHRTSGVEGTERLSSVASNTTSRTPSSYQSAESNGGQRGFANGKELELSWERSQNPLPRSPPPYYREG